MNRLHLKTLVCLVIFLNFTLSRSYAQQETYAGFTIDISWAGSGTEADPYLITSPNELAGLASNVNAGNSYTGKVFKMTANISLEVFDNNNNRVSWIPIGKGNFSSTDVIGLCFNGVFDGNGFMISGIYSTGFSPMGLFGFVDGGTIKNVGVRGNFSCTSKTAYVGGIVGYLGTNGTVTCCYNEATITGASTTERPTPASGAAGGIVGFSNGDVLNCYNEGDITISAYRYVWGGGIVGRTNKRANSFSTVTNCYNTGQISGTCYGTTSCGVRVGGIVGGNHASVTNCYSTGSISGTGGSTQRIGAVVGENNSSNGYTNYCYWLTTSYLDFGTGNSINQNNSEAVLGPNDEQVLTFSSLCNALNNYVETNAASYNVWRVVNGGDYPALDLLQSITGITTLKIDGRGALDHLHSANSLTTVIVGKGITSIDENVLTGLGNGATVTINNPNCVILPQSTNYSITDGIKLSGTDGNYLALSPVNITDGYPFASPKDFSGTISYTGRTFPAENGYGTLILPFAPTTTEGLTFYTLIEVGDEVITFAGETSPAANIPYLFKTTGASVSVAGTSVAATPATTSGNTVSSWTMNGSYETLSLQNSGNNTYYYFNTTGERTIYPMSNGKTLTVNPFRCYFVETSGNQSNAFVVRFGDKEDITSIENLIEKTPLVVFGEKGALTLKCNAAMPVQIYTANGVRVAEERLVAGEEKSLSLPAGIYLVNGNKVLVK